MLDSDQGQEVKNAINIIENKIEDPLSGNIKRIIVIGDKIKLGDMIRVLVVVAVAAVVVEVVDLQVVDHQAPLILAAVQDLEL